MSGTSFAFRPSTRSIISNALVGLCLGLILMTPSCKEAPVSVFFAKTVTLSVDNISCTEAWVRVTPIGLDRPTVVLRRDGVPIDTLVLRGSDTTVVDSGLLPGRSYTYSAQTIPQFSVLFQPRPVQVRTMDTTSHEFTWDVTKLAGTGGSSEFYDVAIINDTLAYAVGEMYVVGEPILYNAAIWNGQSWNLIRIPYYYQGSAFYSPIRSVFSFSSHDIWFCGNGVIRWNGSQFVDVPLPTGVWGPYWMNRLWGSSSQDIFIVGDGGSIVRYDGVSWTKIESGTTTNINDVWGATTQGGKVEVFCAVSMSPGGERKIIHITSLLSADTIQWNQGLLVSSVWTPDGITLYACGDAVARRIGSGWQMIYSGVFTDRVRGNGLNDVFVAGEFCFLDHFNGTGWRQYPEITDYSGRFGSIAVKGNLAIAVGVSGNAALAVVGRR